MMLRGKFKQVSFNKISIRYFTVAVLLVMFSLLASCSSEQELSADMNPETSAISGYDPVAYFTESKPIPGKEEFVYVWNHAKWLFSCQKNMELFKENPERFAPQYNGYCAFALSRNDFVEVNPDAWAIVNDKLYLTYNFDIKNAWLQDKRNYIAKADRNWYLRIDKQ